MASASPPFHFPTMPTIAACARILVSGVKKTSLQVVTNRTSLQRGKKCQWRTQYTRYRDSEHPLRVKICSGLGRSPRQAIRRRTVIYTPESEERRELSKFLRFFSFALPENWKLHHIYSSSSFFTFFYSYHHLCSKDSLHLSSSSAFRSSLLFSLESSAFALPCVVHISRGFHSCLTRTKRPLGFRLSIISLVPCGCFPVPPATPKVVISVVTRSVFHYPPTGARRRHAELAAPIAIGPVPSSSWKKTRKDTAQLPVLLKSKFNHLAMSCSPTGLVSPSSRACKLRVPWQATSCSSAWCPAKLGYCVVVTVPKLSGKEL